MILNSTKRPLCSTPLTLILVPKKFLIPLIHLISARNESQGIRATLDSVLSQDYAGKWDVWVADDRSTDDTPKILEEYAARYPQLHILTIKDIPDGVSPKKHALSKLIDVCDGDILCLTDADCIVKPTWIDGIVREFEPGIESKRKMD